MTFRRIKDSFSGYHSIVVNLFYDVYKQKGSKESKKKVIKYLEIEKIVRDYGDWLLIDWHSVGFTENNKLIMNMNAMATDQRLYDWTE